MIKQCIVLVDKKVQTLDSPHIRWFFSHWLFEQKNKIM